jgi:hypothetical protein
VNGAWFTGCPSEKDLEREKSPEFLEYVESRGNLVDFCRMEVNNCPIMATKLSFEYPALRDLFEEHLDPRRTESASFLIWYLQNYLRLDPVEATDAVCDQKGDKGVDGIYVNEGDATIYILQSKISQRSKSSIGDTPLKEFRGTLAQFKDESAIQNLIASGGKADVARLVQRLDLVTKSKTHSVRGIFVSNIDLDGNGSAFLKSAPEIEFIGRSELQTSYISDERSKPVATNADFDISGFSVSEYIVDSATKALIAPIKATKLAALQGIADQTLFDYNVRGSLGKTQVNRDIVASIKQPKSHKLFPLFHNGITVICESLESTADKIKIKNYYVVNGCQSLTALYENRTALTGDLRVLTKFAKMVVPSELATQVTRFSNNQNGVKPRDFKANDPIQIRLKKEFLKNYSGVYDFEIKRGELTSGKVITNEDAGLYLMAFDLKEPWATHRKYQVFDDKHADLFARPEVTADRIVASHLLAEVITEYSARIDNSLFGKYVLTKYALLYILRLVLEVDEIGKQLIRNPSAFTRTDEVRNRLQACIRMLMNDIVVDVNAEINEVGEDFDYRGKLRDAAWVKDLAKKVVSNYTKLVQRQRIPPFGEQWKAYKPKATVRFKRVI